MIKVVTDTVERIEISYVCPSHHEFSRIFVAGVTVPPTWDCPRCGKLARLTGSDPSTGAPHPEPDEVDEGGRTPWDILMERRTIADLDKELSARARSLRADPPATDEDRDWAEDRLAA